jgi:aldose 1-epimerase
VLPELGARIHRLRAFGHDLLRTPDDPARHRDDPFFWGGYVMAPWCNRIEAEPIEVGGHRVALGSNFPDGTAIHGQVYVRPWEDAGEGRFTIHGGGDGDGWPWAYEASARYAVVDRALTIELTVTNRSGTPMPAGIGIHPWFRRPLHVAIRGDAVYTDNLATTPHAEPVSGPFDLRLVGPMADDLDATWTGLSEPPVEILWPDAGIRMTMRSSSPTTHIVAASPHTIDAVAIEPETHAPQALRRLLGGEPGALVMLDPGATLRLESTLTFERSRAE